MGGRTLKLPSGVTVAEVFGRGRIEDEGILVATLNNQLVGLHTRIEGDALVAPLTRAERAGLEVLRRSCALALHATASREHPGLRLRVAHSLRGSWYYSVQGATRDLETLAAELTEGLEDYAERDVPYERLRVPVEAAEATLTDPAGSKRRLLEAWVPPTVPAVALDGFVDIQHGPVALSTAVVRGAEVLPCPPGLLLRFPGGSGDVEGVRHLMETYAETRDWNRRVGVATIGDLNRAALKDEIGEVSRVAEALHEKKIAQIADAVAARIGVIRLISVAGPSSAGKTTFVRRLSVQLRVNGIEPVVLGLDDYYRPRAEYPRDEKGELDFEALEALNLDLIDAHFEALLRGDEIRVPRFDFVRGVPVEDHRWRPLRLRDDQVLLVEGIHGLNPRLTAAVPEEACFRIYVNALMQVNIDEHNRIPTADVRLLRRIVRDRRYRGTPAADTIARWPSVQRGALRHIFPYDREADAVFNSALAHETAVLKTFAFRYLLEVPRNHPSRVDAYRLMKFLELFVPVFPDGVPANSVLREFIGGSGFSY